MSSITSLPTRLAGQTILITGASSGIGKATAFEFARSAPDRLKLIITARRVDRLYQIAEEIHAEVGENVKICVKQLDISDSDQVDNLIESLPEEFRNIDTLINNAGFMSGYEQAPSIPPDVIHQVWRTNVSGLINITQQVLKVFKMRPRGGSGDIIMLGSIAGREPYAGGSIYCATKAAVAAFTVALRKEVINTEIRIMTVDPGQVLTEFTSIRTRGDQVQASAVYAGCDPLTPDDVAEVIVFAASRRRNIVIADTLLYPTYQAGSLDIHRTHV